MDALERIKAAVADHDALCGCRRCILLRVDDEWLDYPKSEIERDERHAAKVGAAGLWAEFRRLARTGTQSDDDIVNLIVLALRTDNRLVQEVVDEGLGWLKDSGWYAVHVWKNRFAPAADDIIDAARARPLRSLDEEAAETQEELAAA